MHTKEFVRFRIEEQFQYSGLVSEDHALRKLGVLCNSYRLSFLLTPSWIGSLFMLDRLV
jgi:hypothetical protein